MRWQRVYPLSLVSHQQLLLALIGEQFTEAGDICGVVANARPNKDRVVLWTKTASNEAVQVGAAVDHWFPPIVHPAVLTLIPPAAEWCLAFSLWQVSIGRQLKEIAGISERISYSSFTDQKFSSKASQGYVA
ncbi:unnamed protein product [Closterium sp. Yama58-4]|nr:unnamed protein product [Closterium sp. Yama58-4]